MVRLSPPAARPLALRARPEMSELRYELKIVTPQLGGAAEAGSHNVGVRSASVAGWLRSWWRHANANRFATVPDLFRAESEMWGGTSRQSSCLVDVRVDRPGDHTRAEFPYGAYPEYALFPLNTASNHPRLVTNTEFTISIAAPTAVMSEVDTAVRAWLVFGGLGARTRRGCGSVAVRTGAPTFPTFNDGTQLPAVTTLPSSVLLDRTVSPDPVAAWARAVNVYRDFRQSVGFARNPGVRANRPGRSRYPEADTLRRITGRHGHTPVHPVSGFPRADLGLPIIFHFVEREGQREPGDQLLQGAMDGRRRFASPVITKCVQVAGGYRAMVAVLWSPSVWENNLLELAGTRPVTRAEVELDAAQRAAVSPMAGQPIRDALATFVRRHDFEDHPL